VNFGAFLLGIIWAPFHRLWGWFGVFVVLEVLESALGLGAMRAVGGVFVQPAAMAAFRVAYWGVTVAFALRANRLVWAEERDRAARMAGGSARRPPSTVSKYTADERVWTIVGVILLVGSPLSLLVGSLSSSPGVVGDVVVTVGTQAILLVGLFVYERVRAARRQ
jgi:hypothetical protein